MPPEQIVNPQLFFARWGAKILGSLGVLGSLVLGLLLILEKVETRHLTKVNENQTALLDGARSDLAQARTNAAQLRAGIDAQNRAIAAARDEAARRIAAAEARLGEAQQARAAAERRAARIAASPPQGATDCEQLLDIDRRVRESLQ